MTEVVFMSTSKAHKSEIHLDLNKKLVEQKFSKILVGNLNSSTEKPEAIRAHHRLNWVSFGIVESI